jgi:hypothetical protein
MPLSDFLFYSQKLKDFATSLRGSHRGSIDIIGVCEKFGIPVRPKVNFDKDATLMKGPSGRYYITYSGKEGELLPTKRDRFSIAHELAHCYLIEAHGMVFNPEEKYSYYEIERLCDEFAGELLVDSRTLKKMDIDSPRALLVSIDEISSRFGVSREVAAFRMALYKPEWVAGCICQTVTPPKFDWIISSEGTHYHGRNIRTRGMSSFNFFVRWIRKKYGAKHVWDTDVMELPRANLLIGSIKKNR